MMKQVIIPILFCITTLVKPAAQNIHFGLKAGLQFSNYTEVHDAKMALCWHAGGFGAYQLPSKFQAMAGLELSAQGINDSESDRYKQRELHLNLPVTLRYPVIDRLFAEAGLQAGYQLSAKLKIKDDDGDGSYDRLDMYKRTHFAFILGAACQITNRFSAGIRFNLGMNPVFKADDDPRSRIIQLYAACHL